MKQLFPTYPSWKTSFTIALQLTLILLWSRCMLKISTHYPNLSILHNNMWLEWTLDIVWAKCLAHFLCLRFGFFQAASRMHYGGLVLPSQIIGFYSNYVSWWWKTHIQHNQVFNEGFTLSFALHLKALPFVGYAP